MDNSRSKDIILSHAKDVVESAKLEKVNMEGSRDSVHKIFDELKPHVCELMIDPCLLQVIVQNCYQIALDQNGCCMLQQCIGKSPREIWDPLISGILTNSLSLCTNRYI
ncbi:hypothetical protein YC2023_022851 [Brassica napus]